MVNEEENKTTETTNATNATNDLSLKKVVVNYTDKQENMFAVRLFKYINKYCKINVDFNNDKFCCVDYQITSKQDPNEVMYLELKTRDIKFINVPTLIIGYDKMIKINKNKYNKCLLVWDFGIELYHFKYNTNLMKYTPKVIQQSKCIEINKCICSAGMETLVDSIYDMLDINLSST